MERGFSRREILLFEKEFLLSINYRLLQVLTFDYFQLFAACLNFSQRMTAMGVFLLEACSPYQHLYLEEKTLFAFSVCAVIKDYYGHQQCYQMIEVSKSKYCVFYFFEHEKIFKNFVHDPNFGNMYFKYTFEKEEAARLIFQVGQVFSENRDEILRKISEQVDKESYISHI